MAGQAAIPQNHSWAFGPDIAEFSSIVEQLRD